jgi:hypothetical protein
VITPTPPTPAETQPTVVSNLGPFRCAMPEALRSGSSNCESEVGAATRTGETGGSTVGDCFDGAGAARSTGGNSIGSAGFGTAGAAFFFFGGSVVFGFGAVRVKGASSSSSS